MDQTMEAHEAAQRAAMLNEEMWRNPHSAPHCSKVLFSAWLAGWCYGKQQLSRKQVQDFDNMYRRE